MPGRGPAPKPAEQRRRRNSPERGEWIDLPEVAKPILPALPKREVTFDAAGNPVTTWHARTKAAWKSWREDPATTQYGAAEITAAIDLLYLYDRFVRGDTKLASEVRLQRQALGLDNKGKRDLRWRAPTETAAEEPEETKPLAPVRRLRAVAS